MSDQIQLTDAAKFYSEEAHQIRAWEYLQKKVPPATLDAFGVLYRNEDQCRPNKPEPETEVPQDGISRMTLHHNGDPNNSFDSTVAITTAV